MAYSASYSVIANIIDSDATDTGAAMLKHACSQIDQYGDGSGSRRLSQAWSDTRSLVATSETLDLSSLPAATSDPRGSGEALTKIKILYIRNNADEGGGILAVGGAVGTQWAGAAAFLGAATDEINIKPQGFVFVVDPVGYTVGAAATDDLKIDAGANTISYTAIFAGE